MNSINKKPGSTRKTPMNQSKMQTTLRLPDKKDAKQIGPNLEMELSLTYNRYVQSEFLKRLLKSKTEEARVSEDNQLDHYSNILNDLKLTRNINIAENEYMFTVQKLQESVDAFKETVERVKDDMKESGFIETIDTILQNLKYLADNKAIECVEPLTKPEEYESLGKLLQESIPILSKCKNTLDYESMNALAEILKNIAQMIESLKVENETARNLLDSAALLVLQNASDSLEFVNKD